MKRVILPLSQLLLLALVPLRAVAETKNYSPLQREWFEEQGIELPKQFGVGGAFVFMERDVAVDDVRISILNRLPESVADRAAFDVSNKTSILTARADAWILPFLNVYAMAGYTWSDASLNVVANVQPPGGGDPVPVDIISNDNVSGVLGGVGINMVAGFDDWFAMLDANYSVADINQFDSNMAVWLYSGRIGRQMQTNSGRRLMLWGGLFYMDSRRTITINTSVPIIGDIVVDVDQRTANPLTYQFGGSLQVNESWEILAEVGSNFNDAFMLVTSFTRRF